MKTLSAGFTVFGVQNGSECWTSANANATYNKYGTSTNCVNGNKGGPYANAVYRTDGKPGWEASWLSRVVVLL